jgi:dethiobiotin synthetase
MKAPLRGVFVTGTDTGVGKTTVAAGLLRYACRRGRRPIPVKPAETGCDPDPTDAVTLHRAARAPVSLSDVCPHPFRLPAAPAQAAAAEGVRLDLNQLAAHVRALAGRGDFVLVEGAGGLLVPYADGATAADLASALELPLLVVARTALGTVNHTALTLREAARSGLRVAALVLNQTTIDDGPHASGNAALITSVTNTQANGQLPFVPEQHRTDPDYLADWLLAAVGPATLDALLG